VSQLTSVVARHNGGVLFLSLRDNETETTKR
jgi:hypothetical protein